MRSKAGAGAWQREVNCSEKPNGCGSWSWEPVSETYKLNGAWGEGAEKNDAVSQARQITNRRMARRSGAGVVYRWKRCGMASLGVETYEILGDRARCGKVWLSRGASACQRGSRYAAGVERGGIRYGRTNKAEAILGAPRDAEAAAVTERCDEAIRS